MMYLEPGIHTIVASALPVAYYPDCVDGVEAVLNGEGELSFDLTPTTETGTVTVTIDGFDETAESAALSFRQNGLCDVNGDDTVDEDDEIEVYSIPVEPDTDGPVEVGALQLPAGTYTLVASSSSGQSASGTVNVPGDGSNVDIELDLTP